VTVGEWLASRELQPPIELSERLTAALGERTTADVADAPSQFLAVALTMTRDMLASTVAGRTAALDLLTIDALVTYAYEAAAVLPDAGRALALEGMARLSDAVPAEPSPAA
jgi:hypothetical protein